MPLSSPRNVEKLSLVLFQEPLKQCLSDQVLVLICAVVDDKRLLVVRVVFGLRGILRATAVLTRWLIVRALRGGHVDHYFGDLLPHTPQLHTGLRCLARIALWEILAHQDLIPDKNRYAQLKIKIIIINIK